MASALPIVLGAGALLLVAGGKKKKRKAAGQEPDYAPGGGAPGGTGMLVIAAKAVPKEADLLAAKTAYPTINATKARTIERETKEEVEDEHEKETPPRLPSCSIGQLSADKRYVCWGIPGAKDNYSKIQFRRVVKYSTAQATAAALAVTGGLASTMLKHPPVQYALWCWTNRNKGLYYCKERYKTGKKRCKPGKWSRY